MMILLYSALAGILGTGIGGIVSAIIGKRSPAVISWLLSFAAGVMISIVCFGLMPESLALGGIWYSLAGLVAGIVIIMLLNRAVDAVTETSKEKKKIHRTYEELYHEQPVLSDEAGGFLRSGIMMLIAIGLHNIPEGMAIASPLIAGNMRKGKAIFLTTLSGAPTLLGGAIGLLLGNISDIALAISLSVAGGAMLYVVFGEIIPQSVVLTKSRVTTIITLFGIIVGLAITQI